MFDAFFKKNPWAKTAAITLLLAALAALGYTMYPDDGVQPPSPAQAVESE